MLYQAETGTDSPCVFVSWLILDNACRPKASSKVRSGSQIAQVVGRAVKFIHPRFAKLGETEHLREHSF